MKKLFLNITFFSIILYGLLWVMDLVFTKVYQRGDYTKIQWLYHIQNKNFDYAIHGSSRAFTTIDVGLINKQTDLKGINISVDGSTITDQYLMLKIFLENNNTAGHMYLQVDPWSTNTEEISHFAIPKFFPYLKEPMVFEHFKQFGSKWYFYRYVPFLRYAEYNTIWGFHQVLNDAFDLFPQDFDRFGGYFYTDTTYRGAKELQEMAFALEGKYYFLNQTIELCKQQDIELTLFTAPIANIKIDKAYQENISDFQKLMQKKGVEFINYGDLFGNDFSKFTDEIHLNPFGVHDFTQEMKLLIQEPEIERDIVYPLAAKPDL